jgi:predicted GIY-YIG superfamily endonuclease
MKIEELTPLPKEKVQFKLSFLKFVSHESGCYVLSTFDKEVLYIGLTSNLNSRLKQHLNNPEKTEPTEEGKAIWFYYLPYDSINLSKLERTWLKQFSDKHGRLPILNKVNSPL